MIVFLEAQGTNAYNRYTMCPAGWRNGYRRCGNNNKYEDNSSKNLNDKKQIMGYNSQKLVNNKNSLSQKFMQM